MAVYYESLKRIFATAPLRRIEELGGAGSRDQREDEDKTRIVVGVNEFVTEEVPPANLFRVDPSVGDALAERLGRHRAARRRAAPGAPPGAAQRAARGRGDVAPAPGAGG